MKITGVNSGKAAAPSKKAKASLGKGALFAESMREIAGAEQAAAALEPAAVSVVDAVLAMPETPGAAEQRSRRQNAAYGESVLDRLEELRRDLLAGAVPKEKLAVLAQSMRMRRQNCQDPRLNEIISEIELRAEVEIAKLTANT